MICSNTGNSRAGTLGWLGVLGMYGLACALVATGLWRTLVLAGRVAPEGRAAFSAISAVLVTLGAAIALGAWRLGRTMRHLAGYCRAHRRTGVTLKYALVTLIALVLLFPVLWMLLSSLQPSYMLMQMPPTFTLNEHSGLANYVKIFSKQEYVRYFINSFITAGCTVLMVLFISIPAGYSFSRYRFKGRNAILTTILSVQMFPIVVILISLYTLYVKWDFIDSYRGVVLADTTFAMPLAITLMKSFFDTLPRSLDESARIDGAGRMRTLIRILLPLTLPGLVAVGIYTFLSAWDDFLMSMTIMQTNAMKTLPVGLAQSFLGEYAHDYGALMAFSIAGSLPIVLLFVFFQKYMISGLTAGAVKG